MDEGRRDGGEINCGWTRVSVALLIIVAETGEDKCGDLTLFKEVALPFHPVFARI